MPRQHRGLEGRERRRRRRGVGDRERRTERAQSRCRLSLRQPTVDATAYPPWDTCCTTNNWRGGQECKWQLGHRAEAETRNSCFFFFLRSSSVEAPQNSPSQLRSGNTAILPLSLLLPCKLLTEASVLCSALQLLLDAPCLTGTTRGAVSTWLEPHLAGHYGPLTSQAGHDPRGSQHLVSVTPDSSSRSPDARTCIEARGRRNPKP